MGDWKSIVQTSESVDDVSILGEDVTGLKGTNEAPDEVFYSEFSEDEAKGYNIIFRKFMEVYKLNSRIAIGSLEDELIQQNNMITPHFCPIEVILFYSRQASNIIRNDQLVFKKLRAIIADLLSCSDAESIVNNILRGWEWKTQISVLIEAIGMTGNNLIDIAMNHYSRIAALCVDDKILMKSYLNMVLATKNELFTELITDVVTNSEFMESYECVDFFCKSILRENYWKTESVLRNVLEAVAQRDISPLMHKHIGDMKRKVFKTNQGTETKTHVLLNSHDIDYDTKIAITDKMQFSGYCINEIYVWENVKDPRICVLLNRKIMDNIESIVPDEVRGRAYIGLATHSKPHEDEVLCFLLAHRKLHNHFSVPINIALFHMRAISSRDLFESVFADTEGEFAGKNLGTYFRYNTSAISNDFMTFIKHHLNSSLEENELDNALVTIYRILLQFNGHNGKIADKTYGVADSVLHVLLNLNTNYNHSNTYNSFLDIIELIAKYSPANRQNILSILYSVKSALTENNSMPSVEQRIDLIIQNMEVIGVPTNSQLNTQYLTDDYLPVYEADEPNLESVSVADSATDEPSLIAKDSPVVTVKNKYVFISYSSKDYIIAGHTRSVLEDNGICCWMAPESIPAGSDYTTEIPKAIENCDILLLILSESSQNSVWVPKEVALAVRCKKRVIPFHIDNSTLTVNFDFLLDNSQRISVNNRSTAAFEELIEQIKSYLG